MRPQGVEMAKKRTDGADMKTYFVERTGGNDQRVTVPASWKVTFGPLNPGSKNQGGSGSPALRFYEALNKQRMVITGVVSFRDTSIKIEEKRTQVKQQTLHKRTNGGDKAVVVEGRVEEWVNPDAPQQDDGSEFFRLNAPKDPRKHSAQSPDDDAAEDTDFSIEG